MAGLSYNILAKMVLFLVFFYASEAGRPISPKTSTEFIKTSCKSTTYPTLCYTSLSVHATKIQSSPKLLASTSLNVALESSQSTTAMMLKLSQSHGLSPRESGAMADCVEELSNSVYELKRSIVEMNQTRTPDFELMITDVQTWVSAALTDENTCSDGFAEKVMNGNVKNVVRGEIVKIAHLTSNALALINNYASLQG